MNSTIIYTAVIEATWTVTDLQHTLSEITVTDLQHTLRVSTPTEISNCSTKIDTWVKQQFNATQQQPAGPNHS
jgi:hypothetical protein